MIKIRIFSISIILFFSCKDKPPMPTDKKDKIEFYNGAVYTNPYKWVTSISDTLHKFGYVHTPIVYKQGALCFSTFNNTLYLTMINAKDGSIRWKTPRKERMKNEFGDYFDRTIISAYQKDNYLINSFFGIGYDGVENIDLETGNTLWETTISNNIWIDWSPQITGVDSLFFFIGRPNTELEHGRHPTTVYCGNTATGNIRALVAPPYPNYNPAKDSLVLELIAPIKLYNKTHILMGYTCNDTAFVALYNKDDNNWLYKNKLVGKDIGAYLQFSFFSNNRFYITPISNKNGGYMICGNLETGEIIWQNNYFMNWNTLEYKDFLIVCDYDNKNAEKSIVAINKNTGQEVWRINKGPDTFMQLFDGVIYFDNGLLYAINAETGEHYWHLKPHDQGRFSDFTLIETDDEDGAIIIGRSEINAYGFRPVDKNLQAPK